MASDKRADTTIAEPKPPANPGEAGPATTASHSASERAKKITEGLTEGTITWHDIAGGGHWRDNLTILLPALLLVAGSLWLAFQFVEPAPPKTFVIATGSKSGAYFAVAKDYAKALASSGITLEIRSTAGSVENIALLNDPNSGVQAALVQGGITTGSENPNLVSVGRVFAEPLWIFHRLNQPISRLSELAGKKIIVGGDGSGTYKLTSKLLEANDITEENATFVKLGGSQAVEALQLGEADAGFFALGPTAPSLKLMFADPDLRLVDLSQAEAYSRRFLFLQHLVYPAGASDFVDNRPPTDVHLVAPVAALVVRRDLHPTLINLLAHVLKQTHAGAGMFQKPGDFPWTSDPEFELAMEAENYYLNGTPFWQRFLPFWLATFIERMLLMTLPILTIVLPVFKLVPMFFEWRIRRRIMFWYAALRDLERRLLEQPQKDKLPDLVYEVNRIDLGVAALPVPLRYQQQVYDLRGHIDLVRQSLMANLPAAAA